MADPRIRIKRSSVSGKIPSANDVPLGELALNTYDGKLYASKNVGIGTTVFAVNPWTVGVGSNTYNTFFTAGSVGIGTTIPTSSLHVVGNTLVTGIVSATSYFGDGQYLDLTNNPSTGIGIGTTGGVVGYGITFLDLKGAGVSSTFYNSSVGIATIFFEGGGGGSISISTTAPASPGSGDLWYSPDYGRTFIYYDESTVGYGTDAFWVDAAPFNVGVITSTNVSFVPGSATSPSMFFVGDTQTGFFSPTSGQFTIVSTGSSVLNINPSGIRVTGVSTFTSGPVIIGSATSTGTASQPLQVTGGAYVSGNLGIGTTNPTSKLVVSGDVSVSGIITATSFSGTASSTTNIPNLTGAITSVNTTTSLGSFSSSNLATALTDETGSGSAVFATSPTLVTPVLGAASASSIVVSSGSTFSSGPVIIGSATSTGTASQPLQVTGGVYVSGNLGIGTTNPTHKLHVLGDARITGILTVGTGSITLDGSTNTISGITTINTTSINGGPLAGMRNAIINGGMQVAQRSAPTITGTPQYGQADRFVAYISGGTGISGTINQGADAQFKSGYRLWLASLSYTSGTWAIQQRIESFNSIGLNGSTVTVSFKLYHDFGSSRTVGVSLAKANAVDNFSSATGIASVYTSPALTSGAYSNVSCSFVIGASDATNGILLQIADSSATTVSAKNIIIGDVQLEIGPVATTFERRPIGTELALCQRYYQELNYRVLAQGSNEPYMGFTTFATSMRVAPTLSISGSVNIGNVGTPSIVATNSEFRIYNSANNWTANAIFYGIAKLSAEL